MLQDSASRARRISKTELFRLYSYLELYNIRAVIVGGWAVYAYNPYLESIDVDIVTKHNDVAKITAIAQENCGWIPETELADETFSRYAKIINHEDKIFLDILSTNFVNTFHENRAKQLPYALCVENGGFLRKYVDTIGANVPIKELLLLYKLKAYRDRTFRFPKEKDPKEKERLKTKITKDMSDVISLIDPNYGALDIKEISKFVDMFDLNFLSEILENLSSQSEAIYQYRHSSAKDVTNWAMKVMDAFV